MTERTKSATTPPAGDGPIGFDVHRRELLALGAAGALGAAIGPGITGAAQDDDDGSDGGLFLAGLTGDQHTDPVDTDATGGAMFSVNEDGSELEYALLVNALENANQAHIHLGSEDEDGPVAVWLYPGPDATEPELQEGRFDGILATGTITEENLTEEVEGQSMDALLEEVANGDAYVNVHTEANPGGEIRGQLVSVEDAVAALVDDGESGDDDGNGGDDGDGDDNESDGGD